MVESTIEIQIPSIEAIDRRLLTDDWLRRFVSGLIQDYLIWANEEPGAVDEMHAALMRNLLRDRPIMNQ